jgi:sugar O-acyltransferase (sialic acid O-acetyltransferase NeuD family)
MQVTGTLTLVGGGAFARELINWAADAARAGLSAPLTGFLDQSAQVLDGFPYELTWRGTMEDYVPVAGEQLVVAIGDPEAKRRIVELLRARGARFAGLVHPTAVVASSARLGEGVVLCPFSLVSADATIGEFVAINASSSVGHDVRLGAFSTLSAHVDLTGRVEVGDCCFFGTGARVLPGVRIGERSKIGAGTVIMRHVKPQSVMYTPPAKKL